MLFQIDSSPFRRTLNLWEKCGRYLPFCSICVAKIVQCIAQHKHSIGKIDFDLGKGKHYDNLPLNSFAIIIDYIIIL